MKNLLITKVVILIVVLLLITLTSCGTYQVVGSTTYNKEYRTDSTITRVYYDSTTIRMSKN
jgi:predicted small secreted protein